MPESEEERVQKRGSDIQMLAIRTARRQASKRRGSLGRIREVAAELFATGREARLFGCIPVQICQFHQQKTIRKYLISKPKTDAARELKRLSDMLVKTDKESWYDLMGCGIPNTTNIIDAHFSQLKSRLYENIQPYKCPLMWVRL